MKLLNEKDKSIIKWAALVVLTALVIFGLGLLLYNSSSFFVKIWNLFTAVLKPLTIGAMLCYLLLPIVHFIEKKLPQKFSSGRKRSLSTLITVGGILLVIFALLVLAALSIAQKIGTIKLSDISALYDLIMNQYQEFISLAIAQLAKIGISAENILSKVGTVLTDIPKMLSTTLFSIIFAVYFLLDGSNISSYWRRAFVVLAGKKSEEALQQLLHDSNQVFSGYIRGQFVDATIVGVLISITLSVAGVPYAILIGILTGLGNLIPYVGGFVGYGSLIIACLSTGDLKTLLIGAVLIGIVMFVDANIINPKLLSDNIQIHPLLVVGSLIAGASIGGFLGMLVAVPVGALLKIQLDRYLEKIDKSQ